MADISVLTQQRLLNIGDVGANWLDRLDDVVEELQARWGMRVGRPLSGASAAFVAEALTETGDPRC